MLASFVLRVVLVPFCAVFCACSVGGCICCICCVTGAGLGFGAATFGAEVGRFRALCAAAIVGCAGGPITRVFSGLENRSSMGSMPISSRIPVSGTVRPVLRPRTPGSKYMFSRFRAVSAPLLGGMVEVCWELAGSRESEGTGMGRVGNWMRARGQFVLASLCRVRV